MNFALCHICSRPDVPLDDGGRMTEHYEPDSIMAAVGPPCHGSGQAPQAVEKECGHAILLHSCPLTLPEDEDEMEWDDIVVRASYYNPECRFRCQSCRAVFRLECGWLVEEEAFQDSGGNIMTPREGKPHSADGPSPLTPPSFQQNQQPEGETCQTQKFGIACYATPTTIPTPNVQQERTGTESCAPVGSVMKDTELQERVSVGLDENLNVPIENPAASPSADPVPSSVGTMTWQPIATAPKDGTRILAVDINFQRSVEITRWIFPPVGKWINDGHFTHWMPLPISPYDSFTPSPTLSSDLRALLSRHSPPSPDDLASINEFYLSQCGKEGVTDKEIADAIEANKWEVSWNSYIQKWVVLATAQVFGCIANGPTLRSAVIAAITAEGKEKTNL